jgi:hypothetical protein
MKIINEMKCPIMNTNYIRAGVRKTLSFEERNAVLQEISELFYISYGQCFPSAPFVVTWKESKQPWLLFTVFVLLGQFWGHLRVDVVNSFLY